MVLVKFKDKWYVATTPVATMSKRYFSTIVDIKGSDYTIIKNRFSDRENCLSDIIKLQIWLSVKNVETLPTFTDNISHNMTYLAYDGDNLITASVMQPENYILD